MSIAGAGGGRRKCAESSFVPPSVSQNQPIVRALIGTTLLRLFGWRAVGYPLPVKKCVVIGYPHTSNWDLPLTLALRWALDFPIRWIGKKGVFWFPLGLLLRAFGGSPVDRTRSTGVVDQIAELFATNDTYYFALAPEGTRRFVDSMKSGFLQIARAAKVPILLGFIDFDKKEVGYGPLIDSSLSDEEVLRQMREFYSDKRGRNPDWAGTIAFK